MNPPPAWSQFESGATLGCQGSEAGVILLDEEYDEAARMTLERAATVARFAITCGVYGRMMHTRFFATEAEARSEYAAMKIVLQEIVDGFDSGEPGMRDRARQSLEEFLDRFPT